MPRMKSPFRRRSAPEKPEPHPFAPLQMGELASAPGPWLMLLVARAPWEYAAMPAASPWLAHLPVAGGQPRFTPATSAWA